VSGLGLYLNDPLGRELLLQAVLISSLIAAAAGSLSCFLVLKGWALMGDAISHAILPGVVIAYLIGIPLAIGAFFAGMFCAVATGYLAENSRVKQDTVMGVVFSGMFGLGVVLYTKVETEVHLDHILFGDMLGVTWSDVLQTGLISIAALLLIISMRRDLLVFTFDPQHGRAVGLRVDWLHYGLLTVLSLIIVSALQAVGLILSIALVIAPGAIAQLYRRRTAQLSHRRGTGSDNRRSYDGIVYRGVFVRTQTRYSSGTNLTVRAVKRMYRRQATSRLGRC